MIAADLINKYPDRFLFGTDVVAPKNQQDYLRVYRQYQPLWDRLSPNVSTAFAKATSNACSTKLADACGRGSSFTRRTCSAVSRSFVVRKPIAPSVLVQPALDLGCFLVAVVVLIDRECGFRLRPARATASRD